MDDLVAKGQRLAGIVGTASDAESTDRCAADGGGGGTKKLSAPHGETGATLERIAPVRADSQCDA